MKRFSKTHTVEIDDLCPDEGIHHILCAAYGKGEDKRLTMVTKMRGYIHPCIYYVVYDHSRVLINTPILATAIKCYNQAEARDE